MREYHTLHVWGVWGCGVSVRHPLFANTMGCTQSSAAVGPSKSSSSGAGGSGRGGNVVVVQPAATDTSVAARNGGDIEGDVLEDSAFEPSLTASAPPGAAASRFVAMNGSLAGVVRPTLLIAPTTSCHP